jgi:hypothetical protein
MNRPSDPAWIAVAARVYCAALWLFPAALREAHGDEMRQAFRDRCREVARGERSAFRVLALELLPDTLRSAGSEQLSATFGEMRPRQYWALGLLCCAAIGLLCKDQLNRYSLDLAFRTQYALRNMQQAREMAQREARVRRLAEYLNADHGIESKALAAYLYRSLYSSRSSAYQYSDDRGGSPQIRLLPADGDHATTVAAAVLATHPDAYPLTVAVQACKVALGCDRAGAIRRLIAREPDNGYGWSLAFKWAAQHDDQPAMRTAVAAMAQSRYFENYQGRIVRDLLAAAQAMAPGDLDLLAAIASQASAGNFWGDDDYHDDIRYNCAQSSIGHPYQARWLQANPDRRADCLRIAVLLSRSSDLFGSLWGWRQLHAQESDPQLRAHAYRQMRDSEWRLRQQFEARYSSWQFNDGAPEWSAQQWQQWVAAWQPGDGEIPATKRWLVARGLTVAAPAEFQR